MKRFNPTSKSRRHMTVISYRQLLSGDSPHKPLVRGVQRSVGRNSAGRLTTRHKGGGHKRLFREIDFRFEKDGERRYVVIPKGMRVGDSFVVSEKAEVKIGNRIPLLRVPVGSFVYNIEIKPGGGAILVRSAGNYAEVVAVEGGYVNIKLPSSEVRKVSDRCWATVGEVSNEENHLVNIGKAGRSRWLGIRPTVRGSVMNPVDHPYGGGEGKQGRGTRRAKSKWGKPTGKGQKSRRPKKYSNYLVVSRRKVGKR